MPLGFLQAVVAFVAVLVPLILFHELGHFLTAKYFGIRVLEFGVGFPPRLFALRRGETEYSINLLPLGGFVKLLGEEDPTHPRSLASQSVAVRAIVLSSGSFMNAVLPFVLFSILFMVPHQAVIGDVDIVQVEPDSPAAQAGLLPGDRILEVNGRAVDNSGDISYYIQLNLGKPMTWQVQRGGVQREVALTPRWAPPEGQGPTGIVVTTSDARVISRSLPPWEAIPRGTLRVWEFLVITKNEVTRWFMGASQPQLGGPVAIAQLSGQVASAGIHPLLQFAAVLSVNLAIINILPIPALDGGRLLFVIIEWVRRGKRISPQREGFVHLIGFVVLLSIIVIISYQDILRILRGGSLGP